MPTKPTKPDNASLPLWKKARMSTKKSPPPPGGVLALGASLRGTGFKQDADPGDGAFRMSAIMGAVTGNPREKSKVWQLPSHLLNQGTTNSCVGHACAHFILAAPRMGAGVDPLVVWRRAQEIDEFPGNEGKNEGTSVRAGFKAMQGFGLVNSDYHWADDAGDVLRFVLTRGTVVAGTAWYPGMGNPSNGMMRLTGAPDPRTGHAYLLFGFSADQDAFLVANSWGANWGINGMAFLPYDALTRLLQEGGVACSAVQK